MRTTSRALRRRPVGLALALVALATLTARAGSWRPVPDVATTNGYTVVSSAAAGIVITNQFHAVTLYPDSRRGEIDGLLFFLNGVIERRGNDWSVSRADAEDVLRPILAQTLPIPRWGVPIVVLDPGHGGDDSGSVGARGIEEKELTLDIAFHVRQKLLSSAVKAHLTRDADRFIGLSERCAIAGDLGAEVFVSIHLNSSANREASGVETYVVPAAQFPSTSNGTNGGSYENGNRHDDANTLLAFFAHKGTLHYTHAPDRGLKRARYDVLCRAPCPAILIECGFLSNAAEERKLLDVAYRDRIAEGIARGILTYLHRLNPDSTRTLLNPSDLLTGAVAMPPLAPSSTNILLSALATP